MNNSPTRMSEEKESEEMKKVRREAQERIGKTVDSVSELMEDLTAADERSHTAGSQGMVEEK